MLGLLFRLPLIIALMGIGAGAMFLPAVVAAVSGDWDPARAFLFSGVVFLALTSMIALATANRSQDRPARAMLIDLVTAFSMLPVMLAVPLWESVPSLSFTDAYFEMVSSLTTTGASILEGRAGLIVYDAVHLWRALIGWLGGFLMWVMAAAILAPLSLGGFEVMGRSPAGFAANTNQIGRTADRSARLRHYTTTLFPIYAGLTLILWIGLYMVGDAPLVALSHAMSTLATSGISPVAGTPNATSGVGGEAMIALFLVFALSRQTFTQDGVGPLTERLRQDHELRVGLAVAIIVPVLLFFRHWAGAAASLDATDFGVGVQALWGGFFTVLSFLTTTGFESAGWSVAEDWSGIGTPGLIFIGLSLVGGGVATTAGGIKLLRVHVLYRYSQRELERLVHPNSVGRAPTETRAQRRQGAFMAWVFFMLFMLSIAAVMSALSWTGIAFEDSLVLAISALSTVGPIAPMLTDDVAVYGALRDWAKYILMVSMVLGRLETLAMIALFNPDFWRA